MVPTNQIHVVVKQIGINLLFFASSMQEGKTIYTLSKSQLLYEATTSIGIGGKKRDRNSGLFLFLGKMLSLVLRIIHWVDKNALGIGALSVRCTTLELPHVFPLKSLD